MRSFKPHDAIILFITSIKKLCRCRYDDSGVLATLDGEAAVKHFGVWNKVNTLIFPNRFAIGVR